MFCFESIFQKASFLATVHAAMVHFFFLGEIIFLEELSLWLKRFRTSNGDIVVVMYS